MELQQPQQKGHTKPQEKLHDSGQSTKGQDLFKAEDEEVMLERAGEEDF